MSLTNSQRAFPWFHRCYTLGMRNNINRNSVFVDGNTQLTAWNDVLEINCSFMNRDLQLWANTGVPISLEFIVERISFWQHNINEVPLSSFPRPFLSFHNSLINQG